MKEDSPIGILVRIIGDANGKVSNARKIEIQRAFRKFLKELNNELSDDELLEFQSRLLSVYGSDLAFALDPVLHIMSAEYRKGFKTMETLKDFLKRSRIKGLDEFIKRLTGETPKQIFTSKMKNVLIRMVSSERAYSDMIKQISKDKATVKALKEYIEKVIKKNPEMMEMIKRNGEITNGQLSNIKGAIFEILSMPFKKAKMDELWKAHKNAELLTDVTVNSSKTLKGADSESAGFRQVWDDIVAEIEGDKIKIYHIFEMKSGRGGFDEVMDQINRTLEDRLSHIYEIKVNGKVFKKENIDIVTDGDKPLYSVLTAKGKATAMEEMTGGSFKIGNGNFKEKIIQVYYDLAKVGDFELDHLDITQLTIDLLTGKLKL